MAKTLVLGIGNPILGDDGVGIHAVRKLKEEAPGPDYEEAAVSGLELVEMFRGYDTVIIIDAVKTHKGEPGTIYHLSPEDLPTLHGISPHDVDFRTALEYAERFMDIRPEIAIYGIEAECVTDFKETLTPCVEKSLHVVVEKIKRKLENGS